MKPNLLLLIIDSFRSDKFYENFSSSQIPNISKFTHNGTYFSQTISTADATILSWSSIFTSKFPFKTGIRSARFNKLNKETITCFDILKNFDYSFYGYLPKLSETVDLFPVFKNDDYLFDFYQGITNGLTEKIIDLLEPNNMRGPWLLISHVMDLHSPIQVSEKFDDDIYGETYYEKKISEIDFWLGKIIEKVDLSNTIVIITSDHGDYITSIKKDNSLIDFQSNAETEITISKIAGKIPRFLKPVKDKIFLLREKSNQEKKSKIISKLNLKPHEQRSLMSGKADKDHFLFDEKIRVPLLFFGTNIPKDIHISQQVRTVDIFPTLFDILDIKTNIDFDGISLKPLFEGKKLHENPAYIESNPLILTESNDVIGIRTSQYKYFRDRDDAKKRIHLFNLLKDPYEDNNISNDKLIVAEMEDILQNFLKNYSINELSNKEESKEIEEELRKLGYL
jgi:arylsulfatase A-like enzyme